MSYVIVTVQNFRDALPEFSDPVKYPDAFIQRFITESEMFMSTKNFRIKPNVRILCLEYLTAHLIALTKTNGTGGQTGAEDGTFTKAATIDGVQITLADPIAADASELWFQSTPYGRKYWALLTANNPTPVHFIGNPRVFGIR